MKASTFEEFHLHCVRVGHVFKTRSALLAFTMNDRQITDPCGWMLGVRGDGGSRVAFYKAGQRLLAPAFQSGMLSYTTVAFMRARDLPKHPPT